MTGNSSKFFRKILKTGLVTASGAAIMLSSSGALGAAARTTANNGVNLATGANLGEAAAVFTPGSTLQFTGVHTVTAMNINIGAVDMNNFAGGPATITKSIGLGSVVDNVAANKLNASINNGVTLTLTGTGDGGIGFVSGGNAVANDYTVLGNITLGGATAGLTIKSTPGGLITLTGTIDGAGNLLVSTPTNFNAAIGATIPLASVTFNNGNGGNAATAKAITATTVTIGKDAANNASAVSTGKIGGAVNFTADGELTVDGGVVGAVTTAADSTGKLIVTAGNFGAAIGTNGGNILNSVTFNGASNVTTIDATTVAIGAGGDVKTTGTVTADVNFTGDGQLTVGAGGITGAVTTAANDEGTLIVTAGDVADIGVGAPLKQVTFNGASTLNGAIDAQTITINGAVTANVGAITGDVNITSGTLTTNQVITGDLDVSGGGNLAGDAAATNVLGTVTLQAGATGVVTIKNAVDSATVAGGTLNLVTAVDDMTITGGTVNQTGNIIGNLNVSGAGSLIGAATDVKGTVALAAGATGAVTIRDALKAAVVTTEGGTLTLRKAAGGIKFTGTAVAGTTINVVDDVASNVGDVNNDAANGAGTGILNFLGAGAANNIGANASLAAVHFKGAGAVAITGTSNATTFTVGNAGADVTATGLMTGKVAFTADGQLTLGNGITGAVTTAANNTGKLIVTAGDVGGAIGTNAGNILNSVTFNGASNVTTIDATTVAIGAGGDVKTTGAVTADVNFTGDGQLTVGAGGITGAVTTAANDEGTLIVTAGDVADIGVGAPLKQVTFNGASTLNGAIDAQTITINGAVTANVGAITGDVNITSGTLTTNQVITGDLDVSGGGNLAGDAAATNVTKTVTLQATAGNVVIKNATGNVAVAGGTLNLVNAAADMTITGGMVTQTGIIGGDLAVSNGGNLAGDAATTDVTGKVTLFGAGVVTIRNALNAAAVSVGGGTLNLQNAKGGINVDIGAGAGTTVTVAAGGNVNDVQNTTPANGIGILTFKGVGQAGIIGNASSLSEVNVGAGEVTIKGAVVKANAINLTDAGGNSAIVFADQAQVTGAILNTSGTNKKGIVTFTANAGDSGIIGAIGNNGAAGAIETLNTKVDAGKVITLGGDVYTQNLVLDDTAGGNAVGTVEIGGNLTGDVTFGTDANGAGGTLEFNGNAPNTVYDFKGAIVANPNNGTLNVNTDKLIAYNDSVGTLKQIDIQDTKMLQIDASAKDVTVLGVGKAINFVGANSTLGFSNLTVGAGAKNIKFAGNLPAVGGGGGRLAFLGGAAQGDILNVTSSVPDTFRDIGDAGGNKFTSLTVSGYVATKDLDLAGINQLDIAAGANFIDNSGTSPNIGTVNIGAAAPTLGIPAVGAATYTIDAGGVNVPILTPGKQINFADADAELVLQNSSAIADGTITLLATLDPGAVGKGKLTIDSGSNGKKITLANVGGATYGTKVNKLKEFAFAGNGIFNINTIIYAGDLELLVPAIRYGVDINSNLSFGVNTQLSQGGNINGNIDFNNQAAVITLDDGKNITGSVTSSNGVNGTIIALGASTINGPITNLAMLKVGAGAVSITTGGDNSITEIQGTGTNTLTLPENFKLTGAINSTGGLAVKLNFKGGTNSISGVVGTAANPVGGITTAGTTTFTSAVNSKGPITTAGNTTFSNSLNNIGDVTTSGTTIFTGAFNNQGAVNTNGTTTFKNSFANQGDITLANATNFEGTFINTGTLTTQGASSNNFTGTFTNTGAVILAPNSVNTFNQQIIATSINASGSTLVVNAGLPINGTNLTGSGTTITLGSNQLLLSAGTKAVFTDQLTLNTNFDGTANTGGNILITGAVSEMDLSGVTKLKVVVSTTNFDPNNINPNTKYTLAEASSEGTLKQLASANAIETDIGAQENQFLKWNLNPSSLVLSPSIVEDRDNIIEAETKDDPEDVKEIVNALKDVIPGSEADLFDNSVGLIIDNKEQRIKVYEGVGEAQNVVPSSDIVVTTTTAAITNTVVSAMGSLNSRMNSFQAISQPIAVAAGDEDEAKFGVWATPFVGNSTQKMRSKINGNKANFGGATVGFDGMLNDQVVLGVAYTRAGTKIKQKNDKIGDSSKVKSNIYSIYGLYNLPNNNLFFQAVGSYSDSKIKSYSQRYQPIARNTLDTQIVNSNYKSRAFTGQIMAGYDYVAPQAVRLTPMVGLRYSKIKDSGYIETGTTLQNLTVKGKSYDLVNGIAGVKLSKDINMDRMILLIPEIYGMLDYGFKNKLPTPDARLQGMSNPFPSSSYKPVKTTWNVGAGVTAKYQMMEYGINYDVNIASKYFAQQGSLKVRVNF